MKQSTTSNPCSRCGKERIVSRIWKEKVFNSVIVNVEKICPDPECQKIVNRENKKQKDKYKAIRLRTEERATNRKTAKAAEIAKRKKTSKKK